MKLSLDQHDPVKLFNNVSSGSLDRVTDAVMPQAGADYIKSCLDAGMQADDQGCRDYISDITRDSSVNLSLNLISRFNNGEVAAKEFYAACNDIREEVNAHYQGQLKTGEGLTKQEKRQNALIALNAAVYEAMVDETLEQAQR